MNASVVSHSGPVQMNPAEAEKPTEAEKDWAQFEDDNRGLLSNQSKSQWANFIDPSKVTDTSSMSSESESVDDVWTINDEQRKYYVNQFEILQPDLNGAISGSVAKDFFEKSKLPTQELSQIWQLSDINKDGVLSVDEFCIAMHLVVLRRNEIELPSHLPMSLLPYVPLKDEPFAADLQSNANTLKRVGSTPPPAASSAVWLTGFPRPDSPASSSVSSAGSKPPPINFDSKPVVLDVGNKQNSIVHPVPLRVPLSPEGNCQPALSSVTMRQRGLSDVGFNSVEGFDSDGIASPTRQRSNTDLNFDYPNYSMPHDQHPSKPIQSRPRPTPKKQLSVPGPTAESILLPPPTDGLERLTNVPSTNQERPNNLVGSSIPQRMFPVHLRSNSVDTNALAKDNFNNSVSKTSQLTGAPPLVPPRPSPRESFNGDPAQPDTQSSHVANSKSSQNFADFSKFPSTKDFAQSPSSEMHKRSLSLDYSHLENRSSEFVPQQSRINEISDQSKIAFNQEVETQKLKDANGIENFELSDSIQSIPCQVNRNRRDFLLSINKQKDRNSLLTRLNSELNQELQETMEQRIALEIQLEHLRPFSS